MRSTIRSEVMTAGCHEHSRSAIGLTAGRRRWCAARPHTEHQTVAGAGSTVDGRAETAMPRTVDSPAEEAVGPPPGIPRPPGVADTGCYTDSSRPGHSRLVG